MIALALGVAVFFAPIACADQCGTAIDADCVEALLADSSDAQAIDAEGDHADHDHWSCDTCLSCSGLSIAQSLIGEKMSTDPGRVRPLLTAGLAADPPADLYRPPRV